MIIPEAFQVPSGTRPTVVKAAWSWGGGGAWPEFTGLTPLEGRLGTGGRGTRAHQETRGKLA